jgi:hypothetical protein
VVIIRLLLLLSLTNVTYASIGTVTELEGSGIIARENLELPADLTASVEMDDEIQTGMGSVGITFDDDTQVMIGEHSELYIDDFVYDPSDDSGSLGLLVTMGTVKYTSGALAHANTDSVDIQTPSASIAVRGTSFSMTVNEIGDSLIVLLPNLDGTVGEISVDTAVGQVVLNKAFQLTHAKNRELPPSKPIIISIDADMINNLMLISPPPALQQQMIDEQTDALSEDLLDDSFLDEDELEEDVLEFDELEINELLVDLLANALTDPLAEVEDGRETGFNQTTGVYTFITDGGSIGRVVRYGNSSVVDIKYAVPSGSSINLSQQDIRVEIYTNDESENNVNITQD